MNDDAFRGFVIFSESWYADANSGWRRSQDFTEEIMFGIYHEEGGTSGEMAFRWYQLGDKHPAVRLEVFNDAWDVLLSFTDVLQSMKELSGENPSVADIVTMLTDCGFKDRTERESPYGEKASESDLADQIIKVIDAPVNHEQKEAIIGLLTQK